MDSRAQELCRIGKSLFSKKMQWDQLCQEIAENYYPMRTDFTRTLQLGDDFSSDIMDSFPVQSRETLGNSIGAMLRQGDWFSVSTGKDEIDEDPGAARWLEYATKNLRRLVYDRRANFTAATIEGDHDWVTFGNPVLSCEESSTRDHMLFKAWHPRDCAWMLNDSGKVDHIQRTMKMTARNMMRRWPKTCAAEVKNAVKLDPSAPFEVRHIVLPTEDIYGDSKADRKKYGRWPYMSMYVDVAHEVVLGESGLPVFNYVVPRYRSLAGFPQAFSPHTINSLPDGRMLQAMGRIILEQGEKAVDPPMIGRGEIFKDGLNIYSGGFTMADLEPDEDLRKVFQTIEGGNISIGMEMKKDVRELISESFLLNKLFLPDTREMTAFETNARLAEYRRAALPFFGPIESEYNLPLLDVAFSIGINNKVFDFGEAPDILKNYLQHPNGEPDGELTFTFESPLNSAEGRQLVQSFQESVQILAAGAQYDQTLPAGMDLKKMTNDAIKGTGAPADWFKDKDKGTADQATQQQVQGLTQAASALNDGSMVAKNVADASVALKGAGLA